MVGVVVVDFVVATVEGESEGLVGAEVVLAFLHSAS